MLCLLCNVSQQLCDWVEIMGVPLNNKVINQKSIYFLGFFFQGAEYDIHGKESIA